MTSEPRRLRRVLESSYEIPTSVTFDAPDGSEGHRHPCVIALHGMGQDAAMIERAIRPLRTPDRVVVVPDAPLPFEVRETRRVGRAWYVYGQDKALLKQLVRCSLDYVLDLIDRVRNTDVVDENRVSLFGYSQGGYLAVHIALRYPETIMGAAAAAPYLERHMGTGVEPSDARPMLIMHGKKDRFVPYELTDTAAHDLIGAGFDVRFDSFRSGHRLAPELVENAARWISALEHTECSDQESESSS